MVNYVTLNTNITKEINREFSIFGALGDVFLNLAFVVFTYYYFSRAWGTKMLIDGSRPELITSRLRLAN